MVRHSGPHAQRGRPPRHHQDQGPARATKIELKDQWAPRLGLIWDWGKGQDKVYLSLSRYFEQVPLDLVIRSFSDESNPTIFNYSPTSLTPDPAAGTSGTRHRGFLHRAGGSGSEGPVLG